MRNISYAQAISEALVQAITRDRRVFIIGEGVDDPKGIFGTTLEAHKRFPKRVLDMPLSEEGMTGMCVGAALVGMRPIMVHARCDFLLVCMNQIINHAAKWQFMCGGKVPLTIRAIIGRGWGQGAQHSQNLSAIFAYVPGLKVVAPANAYDAKGLLISAINEDSPVIFIEHRWLYSKSGPVPEKFYSVPLGRGKVVKKGKDITVVAISYMVIEAEKAAEELQRDGIDVEIIDPRTLKPLDEKLIFQSVKKTGRLVVADLDWPICSLGAEISARVTENIFQHLKAPVARVNLPDLPTPTSWKLEEIYYPDYRDIVLAVKKVMTGKNKIVSRKITRMSPEMKKFTGPF